MTSTQCRRMLKARCYKVIFMDSAYLTNSINQQGFREFPCDKNVNEVNIILVGTDEIFSLQCFNRLDSNI